MAVQTQIQTRRGSAATWTSTNPTLAAGEIGFESDTNKFKIGTGSTAWASLPYAASISPLTTKGDLYTYSTADARLAVGANGETLVADSSTSTGLRYTAGTVQENPLLNSAMQCWQRGTSISFAASTFGYAADRWYVLNGASQAMTISRQATGDTTNLPFIQYCLRMQRNSGQTGTASMSLSQPMETINSIPFAGKTVTMSFYARCGANYSATSNSLGVILATGTGTDQNQQSAGYTGQSIPINTSATLTTTWQRFTFSATISATATEMQPIIFYNPTGTAGAADFFEVTGVQIDIGSVALPFRTYAGTIQGELAACQRYYFSKIPVGLGAGQSFGMAAYIASNDLRGSFSFPVEMRVVPTLISVSGTNYYTTEYGNDRFDSVTGIWTTKSETGWYNSAAGASGTAGTATIVSAFNAASSIALSAEL